MARRTDASCSECYFRHEGLCALAGETPCPTFRLAARGRLEPPRQAQLVPLTSHGSDAGAAAAAAERELAGAGAGARRSAFA